MYSTPGRRRAAGSTPRRPQQVLEGPITDLVTLIQETAADDWQRRVAALEDLIRRIPDGSKYLDGAAWYNTPKTLWHLALPVGELLKDPRSTVVRRVCTALTDLFNKCQSDARLLFKDIMPTVLTVQAQTVQLIRAAVTSMVSEAIPEVPCKSVMPFWMDRLKDKSPAVRDACSLYLGLALQYWTDEGYLTDEIWMQVGNAMLKTMRDPSPTVRHHAKSSLERMRGQHPHRWDALISDPTGPAARDQKLQQWLRSLGVSEDVEDLSIASKYTYNSESRFVAKATSNLRISSPRMLQPSASQDDDSVGPRYARAPVPFSIAVTHNRGGVAADGPARGGTSRLLARSALPFSHVVHSPAPPPTPVRVVGTPPRPPVGTKSLQSPQAQTYSALALQESNEEEEGADLEYSVSNHETDDVKPADEGPFIASMHELKKHATRRRSRNSILMQERFRNSSSLNTSNISASIAVEDTNNGEIENKTPNGDLSTSDKTPRRGLAMSSPKAPASNHSAGSAPEHIVIAIRLLRAHKSHVDQIMETLKLEMDTLRDFDRLLEQPGRPSEEELIVYYESVELCLEQRLAAGLELRKEMNRISAGDPEYQ